MTVAEGEKASAAALGAAAAATLTGKFKLAILDKNFEIFGDGFIVFLRQNICNNDSKIVVCCCKINNTRCSVSIFYFTSRLTGQSQLLFVCTCTQGKECRRSLGDVMSQSELRTKC